MITAIVATRLSISLYCLRASQISYLLALQVRDRVARIEGPPAILRYISLPRQLYPIGRRFMSHNQFLEGTTTVAAAILAAFLLRGRLLGSRPIRSSGCAVRATSTTFRVSYCCQFISYRHCLVPYPRVSCPSIDFGSGTANPTCVCDQGGD